MITTRNLTKRYRRVQALKGLDLHVPEGSIFGLIGPNGAGKSTSLRILAGLMSASSGEAWVGGVDVLAHPGRIRQIVGYMPDHFGVYEDLTVLEYLEFYAAATGVPRANRLKVAGDLMELVGLGGKRDEWVNGLSLGMKQRLGLARCLVHDPKVLLLDEPASGLDPRARAELRDLLGELRRLGKTIVISSHILPELAEMCTDIGIIVGGRVAASGPIEQFQGLGERQVLEIEVLGDPEAAQAALGRQPGVTESRWEDGRLVAGFSGDDAARAAVLAGLVGAGVQVLSFTQRRDDLEDLFLRLTEGEEAS